MGVNQGVNLFKSNGPCYGWLNHQKDAKNLQIYCGGCKTFELVCLFVQLK